jgi:hypothetical protein
VHVATAQFAIALDLMSVRLDDVLYCEESFPTFPLMSDLLGLGDEGKIFRQLDGWLMRNVCKESLFYELHVYIEHGQGCGSCDPLMALERQNTLLKLIIQKSWIDGVYHRVLEECMKLSLIKLCEAFEFLPLPESLWLRIQILQGS